MSEESISIEDTNKIRISLGLKPIPIPQLAELNQPSQSKDSISLSETNKLRISLGLKPIEEDETTRKDQTTEDYQIEKLKLDKDEKIKERLEIAKNKALKRRKVNNGKSILDYEEEEDTEDWLQKIKKPSELKKAIKTKKTERDMDSFTGLKVNHNIDEFKDIDGDVILTLKDKAINDNDDDDDDGDELESELLNKEKRLQADLAKKLRTDKFDNNGEERHLMERYNDELGENNNNNDYFLLNGDITLGITQKEDKNDDMEPKTKKIIAFSWDTDDEIEQADDYAKAKPIKLKKLKNKPKSTVSSRKRQFEDDDGDVVLQTVNLKDEDNTINDDSELQSILALKRLKSLKKKQKTPEELAKEIIDDEKYKMDVENEDTGFTIDENTEFLSTIKRAEAPESDIQEIKQEPTIEVTDGVVHDYNGTKEDIIKEDIKEDINEEDDVNFSGGLASTLGFLKSKHIIRDKTREEIEQERIKRELKRKLDLDKIQVEISKRIYEQELEQDSGFNKLTKKERSEILQRELDTFKDIQDPREIAEKLKDYKPEINLKYRDQYGRELSQKEAYKQLSHQFHGVKTQSKNKIQKRLKKIEEEKRVEQQPLFSTTQNED